MPPRKSSVLNAAAIIAAGASVAENIAIKPPRSARSRGSSTASSAAATPRTSRASSIASSTASSSAVGARKASASTVKITTNNNVNNNINNNNNSASSTSAMLSAMAAYDAEYTYTAAQASCNNYYHNNNSSYAVGIGAVTDVGAAFSSPRTSGGGAVSCSRASSASSSSQAITPSCATAPTSPSFSSPSDSLQQQHAAVAALPTETDDATTTHSYPTTPNGTSSSAGVSLGGGVGSGAVSSGAIASLISTMAVSTLAPSVRAMHAVVVRTDALADASVASSSAFASVGGSASNTYVTNPPSSPAVGGEVRRALPTSSAFTPPAALDKLRAFAAMTSNGNNNNNNNNGGGNIGGRVGGLFNPSVDVGTGVVGDPIRTPHYSNGGTNASGCAHCTHTTHCDCEYVADVFFDVFEHQLTQKRITERSTSSAAGAGAASSSAASTANSRAPSTSLSSPTSLLDDEQRSNSNSNSNPTNYNAAPQSLSAAAVTSRAMVTGASGRHLCAKSLLPPFVARLIRLLDLHPGDTFYDFGCGNGSILFQVALSAGATCVGVELCPHNAQLARDAWGLIGPIFDAQMRAAYGCGNGNDNGSSSSSSSSPSPPSASASEFASVGVASRTRRASAAAAAAAAAAHKNNDSCCPPNAGIPHVEIITGDICDLLSDPAFYSRPRKILLSNLLFPKELTMYISEKCRKLPRGSMIVCFDDLYPHGRSVCRVRDPEAFELFQMVDYEWPRCSVEWCYQEGKFYIHNKKK